MEIYTEGQIKEMADTWVNYNGFTDETCGKCKKTANVLAGGTGAEPGQTPHQNQ